MIRRHIASACVLLLIASASPNARSQDSFAWSENAGWLNLAPDAAHALQPRNGRVEGYAWAENFGWINMQPAAAGVTVDAQGGLAGFAWGENVGWINFAPEVPGGPADCGVRLDTEGRLEGWAWGENIGWIRFNDAPILDPAACTVSLTDLAAMADLWLHTGPCPADLNDSGRVDQLDFGLLSELWRQPCPDAWRLREP